MTADSPPTDSPPTDSLPAAPRSADSPPADAPARPQDLPALDRLLRHAALSGPLAEHGHTLLADAARAVLADARAQAVAGRLAWAQAQPDALAQAVAQAVQDRLQPRMRRVINLTGTVIHTNLGRAVLADAALQRLLAVMQGANSLEYDLQSGGRGDRDSVVEGLLCSLTGAEAATVVNNNAAAVLLSLAALAHGREVIVSRGELVEIGGAFRMPEVMAAAGARLVEVGTTNRTHAHDYERAITPATAVLMKVHTSNYAVQGFASAVEEATLAPIARAHGLPLVSDLGSGALVDLSRWGLPREPLVQQMLAAGCGVVTFSGDKLLGGPQAGLIVGARDWIERIRRHPVKRALRMGKLSLAALEATLALYLRPERLARDLPTLRLLTRPVAEIEATARAVQPALQAAVQTAFGAPWTVQCASMQGQIGSGSLPVERLPSAGLALAPLDKAGRGRALERLAAALRALPVPVIGRIAHDSLLLDMRCLENAHEFTAQLHHLRLV